MAEKDNGITVDVLLKGIKHDLAYQDAATSCLCKDYFLLLQDTIHVRNKMEQIEGMLAGKENGELDTN
ncbi:MAG: hypothetical protein ACYC7D_05360 [Nitrososphaerales archaeon]